MGGSLRNLIIDTPPLIFPIMKLRGADIKRIKNKTVQQLETVLVLLASAEAVQTHRAPQPSKRGRQFRPEAFANAAVALRMGAKTTLQGN